MFTINRVNQTICVTTKKLPKPSDVSLFFDEIKKRKNNIVPMVLKEKNDKAMSFLKDG